MVERNYLLKWISLSTLCHPPIPYWNGEVVEAGLFESNGNAYYEEDSSQR